MGSSHHRNLALILLPFSVEQVVEGGKKIQKIVFEGGLAIMNSREMENHLCVRNYG